ncbi:MAG: TraB/GumN family protein [Candidatus Omnitrophota bacterium]
MNLMRRRIVVSIWVIISILVGVDRLNAQKNCLWQIKTNKGNSYLLGSIHLLKKEHYPLPAVMEQAFDQTDVLVLEVDMSGEKLATVGVLFFQKGFYQGEDTLQHHLSQKNYKLLAEKLKPLDMDIEGFQKTKPWMVAMIVLNSVLVKLGFAPQYGIDIHFMEKAISGNKEIRELEGAEFQLNLFETLTPKETESFLMSTVLEAGQLGAAIDRTVNAWKTGDLQTLDRLSVENIKDDSELETFYYKLLDKRNIGMAEKIDSYLKEGKKIFVVVGAAHMTGKNGIVNLLKNKGYNINQL